MEDEHGSRPESDRPSQQQRVRGKLKIYFGYATGVGKTYAMLDDAANLLESGFDVIIGVIPPNARSEIKNKSADFRRIPPRDISSGGAVFHEFDLDEALRRRPQIILIDELAHANAAGMRHKKRWQDVEELLASGIDVYTTVNVQNIESLNDIVSSVTGVQVKETVPDSVFDEADQVELIDIEPESLQQRLRDGKVYTPRQAAFALEHFFKDKNLVALREIAMRRCADRISKIHDRQRKQSRDESWAALGERLLVCLSAAPSNGHVIRAASRIAEAFHAYWIALYVQTSERISGEEQTRLEDNMALAERLGARVVTVRGSDIAGQIVQYARSRNVSRIVIGKNHHNISGQRRWLSPDIADKIIAASPYIDVYVIPEQSLRHKHRQPRLSSGCWVFTLKDAVIVLAVLLAVTLVNLALQDCGFPDGNFIMLYLMGVLFISSRARGHLPGILFAIVSVIAFTYFFTVPYFCLTLPNFYYAPIFIMMLAAALITSALSNRIRNQAEITNARDKTNDILLQTSRVLMRAHDRVSLSQTIADHLVRLINRSVVCYIPDNPDVRILPEPALSACDEKPDAQILLNESEKNAAAWVLANAREAGSGTDTLPGSAGYYIPIIGENRTLAVLGVLCGELPLPQEHKQMIRTVAGQIALAIEREALSQSQMLAQKEVEREQLRSNLLHAVSHDLRTPLAGIAGAANTALENDENLDPEVRRELLRGICEDADWLIQIVENLLSVTRIDNGKLKLNFKEEMLEEIVAESIERVEKHLHGHRLTTNVQQPTAIAVMDGKLIEQVLVNLIDNAVRYTPEETLIQVRAWCEGGKVLFEVQDGGEGLNEKDIPFLFDRFYSKGISRSDTRRGIGLGLSISKSIVNAHGGDIIAYNAYPKGAAFRFWLPIHQTGEKL